MANIEIGGRLHSTATGNVVTGANEVLDDIQNKKQQEINTELIEAVGTVDSRIVSAVATETSRAQEAEANRYTKSETYNKEEVNNLITTPNQEYVSVTATSETTSITDILPTTGAANTIYRVGNWDGTQYNDSVFSEYAWDGSTYVLLNVKEYGIDDVPTAGSNNLVKSSGVYAKIKALEDAGYVFAGVATPETNPGTPNHNIFYIASEAGTYTNFGGITLMDEAAILSNTNGSWVKSNTGIAISTKVSELDGKVGTFDKNIQNVENNSFINVCIDADNKIIEAIDDDGTKHHYLPQVFHANIEAPNLITEEDIEGKQDILPYNVSNNEIEGYAEIKLDAEGKLLEYIKKDGTKGFTSKIESPTIIDIYNQIRGISSVSIVDIAKAKWKGKRYLAIGDSITWGVNAYNSVSGGVEYHQYAKNLCELLELAPHKRVNVPNDSDKTAENFADTTSSLNVGISGNIIQNVLAQEYAPIANKNFDIVTILIGINNVLNNSYTLGDTWYTIDSDGNRTYLLTGNTYKACFNKLLKTILEDNPKAKVLVMTLTHSNLDLKLNLENKGVVDYVNAIKEGCSIWGVECVDLFQNVQINPNIESKYQAYFRYDLNDALHPNIEAHKLITEEIIKHLI